jgi:hypothetical protein
MFNDDEVLALNSSSLSGESEFGLGIPPPVKNAPAIRQLAAYLRADRCIANDFAVPRRWMSPEHAADGSVAASMNGRDWRAMAQRFFTISKKDPSAVLLSPEPMQAGQFGGDAKLFTPHELVSWHSDHVMDQSGYPSELMHGTVQIPLAPTRIRFFERSQEPLARDFRRMARWIPHKVCTYYKIKDVPVRLKKPDDVASLSMQQIGMQLMASGQLSAETFFDMFFDGVNPNVEQKKLIKESIFQAKVKQKGEEEMQRAVGQASLYDTVAQGKQQAAEQQAAEAQQQQGGGGGAPPGNNEDATPLQAANDAQTIAERWIQYGPDNAARRKDMVQVGATDEALHDEAMTKYNRMKDQAGSQGTQQFIQNGGQQ